MLGEMDNFPTHNINTPHFTLNLKKIQNSLFTRAALPCYDLHPSPEERICRLDAYQAPKTSPDAHKVPDFQYYKFFSVTKLNISESRLHLCLISSFLI